MSLWTGLWPETIHVLSSDSAMSLVSYTAISVVLSTEVILSMASLARSSVSSGRWKGTGCGSLFLQGRDSIEILYLQTCS